MPETTHFDPGSCINMFYPTVFAFAVFRHLENKPLYSASPHEVQPNKTQAPNTISFHFVQLLCREPTSPKTCRQWSHSGFYGVMCEFVCQTIWLLTVMNDK